MTINFCMTTPPVQNNSGAHSNTIARFWVICTKCHEILQTKRQKWAWLMTISPRKGRSIKYHISDEKIQNWRIGTFYLINLAKQAYSQAGFGRGVLFGRKYIFFTYFFFRKWTLFHTFFLTKWTFCVKLVWVGGGPEACFPGEFWKIWLEIMHLETF